MSRVRLPGDSDRIAVERAIAEIRMARPVLIQAGTGSALAAGVEELDPDLCVALDPIAAGRARIVLPASRLRCLELDRLRAGTIALPRVESERIAMLALKIGGRVEEPVGSPAPVDEDALELARLALLLPAALVIPIPPGIALDRTILRVSSAAVRGYRGAQVRDLTIVGRTPVPLEGAPGTEFVVFRGGEGLRDQVAVLLGCPDLSQPVAVRLHSACLTGDLFGSLKCDCGDQLRRAAHWMAEHRGGILLYLDQEGRGIGIANKIRAYELQAQGYDTYEADEALGFEWDERRFDFAAEMLRQLGVHRIRLLTNNPEKAAALRRAGLDVVSEHRVIGRSTPENLRYLAAKRDRAGHVIEFDASAAGY
jgi:GTP cyclohydrolase II